MSSYSIYTVVAQVAAQRVLIDGLAAANAHPAIECPATELVEAIERLPEQVAPLWASFYGRQALTDVALLLIHAAPIDAVLTLLVWRYAASLDEEPWRLAIDDLAIRARWIVRPTGREVV